MDCDDLFEEDVEEVIDDEDVEGNNYMNANDVSEEDTGVDIEDDENSEGSKPVRDDSAYIFSLHKGSVFCCHLEPKTGRLAVTGAEDEMTYVWETHSGDVVLHCKGHKDSVTCVQFNYDGSYVATGDMSGVVQVWKIASKLQVWETHVGDLTWLKWHHGANVLLAGTVSGDVYMWRIPGGDCKLLPGGGVKTDCGLILPDGKRAAVGYEDGTVKVFDMKACTVLHHVPQGQANAGTVTDMDCHPDNNLLITGSVDGHAVILKTQTGKVAVVLDCKGSSPESESSNTSVEAVGFCQDSNFPLAATGSLDGVLCIWDISRGSLRHRLKQDSGITKLVWVKSGPYFFTTDLDGSIRLYDARSGSMRNQLFGHSNCILDISCSM
ncbi:hypothetical protein Cfor_08899 [Coptotermes formosanus]|uniref:Angio-associated migratory cell protein n=1 Tax=Coptotermes formosanus TaxID=36987 RepID=A0A6L2Q7M3_COPFO|nr:hypothetical protein Cfor_08899 [Coptotermes formosanus]